NKLYADSIYHSYSAFINTAKALLLGRDVKPSTQIQTLLDFQRVFVDTGIFEFQGNFRDFVLRINKNEPTESFALKFLTDSANFLDQVVAFRSNEKVVMEK